jgi:hypothetical protein
MEIAQQEKSALCEYEEYAKQREKRKEWPFSTNFGTKPKFFNSLFYIGTGYLRYSRLE